MSQFLTDNAFLSPYSSREVSVVAFESAERLSPRTLVSSLEPTAGRSTSAETVVPTLDMDRSLRPTFPRQWSLRSWTGSSCVRLPLEAACLAPGEVQRLTISTLLVPPPDYIYTADKLQRTARWLENMEGGIEKLKKVIIEDELGICGALEKAMSDLIGTYECEWTRQSFPLPSPRSRCGGR